MEILLGGLVTYFLAKVVKKIVVRGRPPDLVDDVRDPGSRRIGSRLRVWARRRRHPSGHPAWPYLSRNGRIVAVALAVAVCLARVYVGAHLPLDIVGGAASGWPSEEPSGSCSGIPLDYRQPPTRTDAVCGAALSAIAVGVMVAVPFTKHYVQNVDDAVRRAAVSVQNRPTTLIAEGFSLLGGTWVNWSIRVVALVVLAVRRQLCNWPPSAWRWCPRRC